MNDDRRKILHMLGEGKITADEAERLLSALDGSGSASGAAAATGSGDGDHARSGQAPKYLRVMVTAHDRGGPNPKNVNIRVPLQILRAGVKLQGLLPPEARSKLNAALGKQGVPFDLDQLKGDGVDQLIESLRDSSIDIDASDGRAKVRVFCE